MTVSTYKASGTGSVFQVRPTAKAVVNPSTLYIRGVSGSIRRTFMYIPLPNLSNLTDVSTATNDQHVYNDITSVLLKFSLKGSWPGSTVVTAVPLAGAWSLNTLTYNVSSGISQYPSLSVSTTITSGVNGQTITMDITNMVKAVKLYGGSREWRGIKLVADSGDTGGAIYGISSLTGYPRIVLTYERRPDTPQTLVPGNVTTKVSTDLARPDLSVADTSLIKDGTLTEMRVMISPVNTEPTLVTDANDGTYFSATSYDSGAIAVESQTVVWSTLPSTDSGGTALPTLSDGQWVKWVAAVKDSNGNWSRWSPITKVWRENKPTVTLINPASPSANFVEEYTPTIDWTVSGATQSGYRVIIYNQDTDEIDYDSGVVGGSTTEHQIPLNVIFPGVNYRVGLKVYDAESSRVTGFTDGVPSYHWVQVERNFTYQPSGATAPVTDLTATNPDPYPWIDLTWKRTGTPDGFLILRDGVVISDLTATGDGYLTTDEANFVAPDNYSYRDYGPLAKVLHEYTVVANDNNEDSLTNPTVEESIDTGIVWLVDRNNFTHIPIAGSEPVDMNLTEVGTTHTSLNSSYSVRITSSKKKYSGSVNGVLCGECLSDGTTSQDLQDYLLDFRERSPDTSFRLLVANVNIPVVIYDVSTFPLYGPRYNKVFGVTFNFHQVGA